MPTATQRCGRPTLHLAQRRAADLSRSTARRYSPRRWSRSPLSAEPGEHAKNRPGPRCADARDGAAAERISSGCSAAARDVALVLLPLLNDLRQCARQAVAVGRHAVLLNLRVRSAGAAEALPAQGAGRWTRLREGRAAAAARIPDRAARLDQGRTTSSRTSTSSLRVELGARAASRPPSRSVFSCGG